MPSKEYKVMEEDGDNVKVKLPCGCEEWTTKERLQLLLTIIDAPFN